MLRDTLTKQLQSLSKALEEVLKLRKREKIDSALALICQSIDTNLLSKIKADPASLGDARLSEPIKYLLYFQYQELQIMLGQGAPEAPKLAAALYGQVQDYIKANEQTYYFDLHQMLQELETLL